MRKLRARRRLAARLQRLIRVADYLAFLEQHTYDGRSRIRRDRHDRATEMWSFR
jgi:hypothetical protein